MNNQSQETADRLLNRIGVSTCSFTTVKAVKRTLEEEKKSLIGIDDKYKDDYYNWVIVLKSNNAIIGRANLMVEEYNEC